ESAVNTYIDAILSDAAFVADITSFVEKIIYAGRVNSLAQTLIKHTAPGVPDLYQGAELWNLSLVDPDNRRPVDYELRRKLLNEMDSMTVAEIMQRSDEGLPKLWTVHRALHLRNQHPEWFGKDAAYKPIQVRGSQADRVIAYLRGDDVLT